MPPWTAKSFENAPWQATHLVADDTYFDSTRLGPGWNWDDEPYFYAAQVSALLEGLDWRRVHDLRQVAAPVVSS